MRKPNVFVVPGPPRLSYPALRNMIEFLKPLAEHTYIVLEDGPAIKLGRFDGNELDYSVLKTSTIPTARIAKQIFFDLTLVFFLVRIRKRIDILLNFQSESILLTLLAKLLKKKVIHLVGGSLSRNVKALVHSPNLPFAYRLLWLVYDKMSTFALELSDKIVLISPRIVGANFHKAFSKKIEIAGNFPSSNFYDHFFVSKAFSKRPLQLGYVGELSQAKGVLQLTKAIPRIVSGLPNLKIVFIGDTKSKSPTNISSTIQEELSSYENVFFVGHLPYNEMPKYLNELRLLVLPSFSEGVPAVLLEAMACGTPVAATSVGAVKEIITDRENGYILRSNSPDYLAQAILTILVDETIEKVAMRGQKYVQENYNYEKTANTWQKILRELQQ